MKNYSQFNNNAVAEKVRVVPEVSFFRNGCTLNMTKTRKRNNKERAGPRLTCVAGHSHAHVIKPGLNWQITDNVISIVWCNHFVDGRL